MAEKWGRWYNDEVKILKEHYPKTHRDELLKLLPGRSWRAVGHAAEKYKVHRGHGIPKTEKEKAALHTKMSTARGKRAEEPFAGKHHTAETKLAISVTNLYVRGHGITDIAHRKGISKMEVKEILGEREKKK